MIDKGDFMSTTQKRAPERKLTALNYLTSQGKPLRLQDFGDMLKELRGSGNGELFPLNNTTVKSTLKALVKCGLVQADPVQIGNRTIIYYKPTATGVDAYVAQEIKPCP